MLRPASLLPVQLHERHRGTEPQKEAKKSEEVQGFSAIQFAVEKRLPISFMINSLLHNRLISMLVFDQGFKVGWNPSLFCCWQLTVQIGGNLVYFFGKLGTTEHFVGQEGFF